MNGRIVRGDLSVIKALPLKNENAHYCFTVDSPIPFGSYTLPTYSKGIYIASWSDAVLIAVDFTGVLYIGFRNNGKWERFRKI